MFDFLLDADYWLNALAFVVNLQQSGFYMIPQAGWKQAIEAWASDKMEA